MLYFVVVLIFTVSGGVESVVFPVVGQSRCLSISSRIADKAWSQKSVLHVEQSCVPLEQT